MTIPIPAQTPDPMIDDPALPVPDPEQEPPVPPVPPSPPVGDPPSQEPPAIMGNTFPE